MEAFIEKAKRYASIDELTPELLRLFIQRIEVGERSKKHSRNASQSIRIVYRDIGALDSMMLPGEEMPYIKPAPNIPSLPDENREIFEEIRKAQTTEHQTDIPA